MFKWWNDPGHGWLQVPLDIYNLVGFKASEYSYLDKHFPSGGFVYLEEDCDAPGFIKAWEEKFNRDFDEAVVDSEYQENIFIRMLRPLR